MSCRNTNTNKYFCQNLHRHGKCAEAWVQKQCAKSCSCPDDHYSALPGRFASNACPSPLKYPKSERTLVVINSNTQSPFSEVVSRTLQGVWHLVVYGNSNKTQISQKNSTIHLQVKHDSIDFTGIIAVVDHFSRLSNIFRFDRIFYMHDTMLIHNRSAFLRSLDYYSQVRTCSLQMGQSMNIGIYSVRDLFRSTSTLRTLRGRDNSTVEERLKLKIKGARGLEGILFDINGAWATGSKCGCELSQGPNFRRVIDNGIFRGRKELCYESWGFSKFQHSKEARTPKNTSTRRA